MKCVVPGLVRLLPALGVFLAMSAHAQSFRVQCPTSTQTHPNGSSYESNGSTIKCQQIAGGDGYATMGDGTTTYLFGFGPLSGLKDIYHGLPGTQRYDVFNTTYGDYLVTLDPVNNASLAGTGGDTGSPGNLVGMPDGNFAFNGAIGLTQDLNADLWISGYAYTKDSVVRAGNGIWSAATSGTAGAHSPDTASGNAACPAATNVYDGGVCWSYQSNLLDGHVDARPIMDVGVMNANQPAPMIAIDEDDELFLTLTNVGMIMRPDLFEQHTVHFHGYPNASSFYDGVPDASVAINIGGSFTYYYLAPDAGTYFWHCHISPPEHLQMGMVGQLFVRPRQNRLAAAANLQAALAGYEVAPAPKANPKTAADWQTYEPIRKGCRGDILCSTPVPAANAARRGAKGQYAYNDGDGSTYYDVDYPLQLMGFDPNFHFVGMTFNPESFNDMKDKYFLLNGRSYPDTVGGHTCVQGDPLPACANVAVGSVVPGPMQTQSTDGTYHSSQPLPTVVNIPVNGKALLRISDLNVTEYHTLATLGIPMKVIALNARLLRDMAGNNMAYKTNSITLGGGESLDVLLDATGYAPGQKFYLYTPNLDHLANDAENFGGMMTEINICPAATPNVDPQTKACRI
jgi:FtsP/CotA-like multicopper oxidase with cupredoxin domain